MAEDADESTVMCFKCDEKPAGPGGVLCPDCLARLKAEQANYWSTQAA